MSGTTLGNGNITFGDGTTQNTAGFITVANNAVIELSQNINSSYTVSAGRNALTIGPITLAANCTITVPANSRFVIL